MINEKQNICGECGNICYSIVRDRSLTYHGKTHVIPVMKILTCSICYTEWLSSVQIDELSIYLENK